MDEAIIITFRGNQQIETASLEAVIGVRRSSALAFWKEDISTINALYIPKLDEIFRLYYKKEGFYDANITHKIDEKGIHFFIEEHRFIKINSVEIESDFEIEDVVLLEKGTRFRAKAFSEMKEGIKKKLLKEGLCSYKLNTKAFIDLEKQSAKILIKLQKGKVCHFGKITIDGTPNISDDVILSRLHFKENEAFNLYKIKESYESLYDRRIEHFRQRDFFRELGL